VDPRSIESIRNAIIELTNNEGLRNQLVAAGKEKKGFSTRSHRFKIR